MRRVFVRTSNVSRFISAMSRIQSRQEGIPGMALVYGEPGLGKTRTCLWWCAHNDGVFVRVKKLMNGRWLLEETVAELGVAPARRISDLYRQVVDQLLERPRVIFYDEADYLVHDSRVIETLRDIYDTTQTPIVLIGMDQADKKLGRFRHLWDRLSEIVKFQYLTEEDVKTIAEQMCEVKLTKEALSFIHSQAVKFRRVVVWLYLAEAIAKTNNLKEIGIEHLKNAAENMRNGGAR